MTGYEGAYPGDEEVLKVICGDNCTMLKVTKKKKIIDCIPKMDEFYHV